MKRLAVELFGDYVEPQPPQPTESERLRRTAAQLRELANKGMKPRAYAKKAAEWEREAERLEALLCGS